MIPGEPERPYGWQHGTRSSRGRRRGLFQKAHASRLEEKARCLALCPTANGLTFVAQAERINRGAKPLACANKGNAAVWPIATGLPGARLAMGPLPGRCVLRPRNWGSCVDFWRGQRAVAWRNKRVVGNRRRVEGKIAAVAAGFRVRQIRGHAARQKWPRPFFRFGEQRSNGSLRAQLGNAGLDDSTDDGRGEICFVGSLGLW